MKITICSSAVFFNKLNDIKKELEIKGFEVFLPNMRDWGEEDAAAKVHHDLIRAHFKKIDQSDAIYVANYDKKGISGYIGGNTFLEMGKAYDKGIPIFLMKDIPDLNYKDELIALQPIIIGENWSDLHTHLLENE